jgi:exopolysaccharide production protein ExoQ
VKERAAMASAFARGRQGAADSLVAGASGRPTGRSRTIFAAAALAMSVGAFYVLFKGAATGASTQKVVVPTNRDNLLYVGLWLILYGVSGCILLRSIWRNGVELRHVIAGPFAVYVLLSALWADNPTRSIVPAAMLALDMVIAAALAATVGPHRFLRTTARLFILLTALSLLMLVLVPSLALTDPDRKGLLISGELVGAFAQKTALGNAASIGLIVLLFLPGTVEGRVKRALAVAILFAGLLLSNSMGSISAGTVALAALAAARLLSAFRTVILAAMGGLTMLWSLLLPFVGLGAAANALGRSSDLTGRGDFWPLVPGFITQRPFFGYGYMGFFNDGPYSRAWDVWDHELYFFTPEFHNTFFDVVIGLGLVGGLAYLATLATSLAIIRHPSLERRCADVLVTILIFLTTGCASEYTFLAHNNFATVFLFYCFFVGGRSFAPAPAGFSPQREALELPDQPFSIAAAGE